MFTQSIPVLADFRNFPGPEICWKGKFLTMTMEMVWTFVWEDCKMF